jgi:peptidoglycan/LPS O-acetylase OafA/YrhL
MFAELPGPLVRLAPLRDTIGATLMTAAMAVWLPRSARRSPPWLSRLADLSLAVYLLHPLVLIVAQRATGPLTTPMAVALWATALGSSYVLASLLASTAFTAWLLEAPWRRVRLRTVS